jgi:hypothetical protein
MDRCWHRGIASFLVACMAGWSMLVEGASAQERYSFSDDGSEVSDRLTGLTWRRCSEGQSWTGQWCSGAATNYTYSSALRRASEQTGWRLPNVKELSSIVDTANHSPPFAPAIDNGVFPNVYASGRAYWTSTPDTRLARFEPVIHIWTVDFAYGLVTSRPSGDSGNVHLGPIRLVR